MIRKVVLASMMMATASGASAGEQVFDFSGLGTSLNTYSVGDVYSTSSLDNTLGVQVSAWSSTGTGCSSGNTNTGDVDACIESAALKSYNSNGLGIQNVDETDDTPNHAIDNSNANKSNKNTDLDFDMLLFTFDEAVQLSSVGVGWTWKDADASIVAYTGSADFSGFSGSNWSNILNNGWESVTEVSKGDWSNQNPYSLDDGGIYSTHWLVGAYNQVFSSKGWTQNNDAFKFNGLTVMTKDDDTGTSEVSAPATTAVMLAIFAFMAIRRKS